jgi:hypothetical protein
MREPGAAAGPAGGASTEVHALSDASREAVGRLVTSALRSKHLQSPAFASAPRGSYALSVLDAAIEASGDGSVVAVRGDELVGLAITRASAWDIGLFGFGVGRVECLIAVDDEAAAALASWIQDTALAAGWRVASARLAGDDVRAIGALTTLGFEYRETTLSPIAELSLPCTPLSTHYVRPASPDDERAVLAIARSCFSADRFHSNSMRDGRPLGSSPTAQLGPGPWWSTSARVRFWASSATR